MLTGNEPVSAGNLRAIVGAHARKTGMLKAGEASARIAESSGMSAEAAVGIAGKFPSVGFSLKGGAIVPDVPGVYAVSVEMSGSANRVEGQSSDIAWFGGLSVGGAKIDFGDTSKESSSFFASFAGNVPIDESGLKILVCGKSTAYYEVNFGHEIKLNNLKVSIVEI